MKKTEVIDALKNIGFSEYEAKVYITLLQEHPQNGNTLSQSSGVPASKVYEVLRKMQEKGYVYLVTAGKKTDRKWYSPLPYHDLLKQTEKNFTQNIGLIQDSLDEMNKNIDSSWTELYNIEGYETSIELIKEEIKTANSEIIMVCWNEEFRVLLPLLKGAYERGINIATITFDHISDELSWHHVEHAPISTEKHIGELSVVIDNRKAIVFDSASKMPNAVISSYYSMVKAIRNYITHDMYINRIHADLEKEFKELYGGNLEKLFDSTI